MTATVSRPGSDPAARMMRGREHEWGAVLGLLAAVEAGRPGILLVEGEQGAGKSLLLEAAVRAAAARGLAPVAGRAREPGLPAPGEPLLSALDEPPPVPEARLAGCLRTNLEQRTGPVLVVLDDLQWAGPATFGALQVLAWDLPVAWLLARTTGPYDATGRLFDAMERDGAGRCPLGPLGDGPTAEIAIDVLGAVPDPDLVTLAAGAGGNPYLIIELLTGLRDEGAVRVSGGRAHLSSARLPDRVRAGIGRRLGGLSPRTRHLLTVSAVLGRSPAPEDVAEVLDTTPAMIVPALDEALAHGLLTTTPDALGFRQELVRRTIVEALPLPVRRALHRQIGEMLADRPDPPAAAAFHLLQGARTGDGPCLARLDEMIAAVLPRSPQNAAELAVHALELTGPGRPEHTLTAVHALTATGRLDEAADLARAAFARPMPALPCARLHCLFSEVLRLRGRPDEAAAEASAALAEPCLADGLRDAAELTLLNATANAGGPVRERAEAIVATADEHGDALVTGAFLALARAEWDVGRLASGLALAREAVRRAASPDARRLHPRLVLATLLTDAQRHDAARTTLASAGDPQPQFPWTGTPGMLTARAHLAAGRFGEAAAEGEAAVAATGGLGTPVYSGLAVLAAAALRTGDLSTARQYVTGRCPGGSSAGETAFTLVAAQVSEAREGAASLDETFGGLCEQVLRHRWTLIADPALGAWLVRTAHALGDRSSAETMVAAVERLANDNPEFPAAHTAAVHARGLLEGSARLLRCAATEHTDRWARASAAEDLARLTSMENAAGARQRAVTAFDAALSAYESMGAVRDAARVRRRLRRLGVRRRHWSQADRPVSGWASLTDTERAVSELAAQGLTNRQIADQMFMSAHTVAFHLRHVFRKLGVGSRVELTRLVLQRSA